MSDEGRITVWSHPDYENMIAEFQLHGVTVIVTQNNGPEDFEVVLKSSGSPGARIKLGELDALMNEAKRRLAELGWKA